MNEKQIARAFYRLLEPKIAKLDQQEYREILFDDYRADDWDAKRFSIVDSAIETIADKFGCNVFQVLDCIDNFQNNFKESE